MKTREITLLGIFTAVMLILGAVENAIVLFPGIPGIKPGLSNCVLMFTLYTMKKRSVFLLAVAKVTLCALLFGNVTGFVYSAAGAFLSVAVMMMLLRVKSISCVGLSVLSAFAHMTGQLLASRVMLGSFSAFAAAPWLMLCALVAGIFTGFVTNAVIRLDHQLKKEGKS